MCSEKIELKGITPIDHFPDCPNEFFTEFCETDPLYIPANKPSIENILEVYCSICVTEYKTIYTPVGRKLIIEGIKQIKILYIALETCQNVHSATFEIPFCTFILLKNDLHCIKDICAGIEHISICPINCRYLYISLIIFVYPILVVNKNDCCCNQPCKPTCETICTSKPSEHCTPSDDSTCCNPCISNYSAYCNTSQNQPPCYKMYTPNQCCNISNKFHNCTHSYPPLPTTQYFPTNSYCNCEDSCNFDSPKNIYAPHKPASSYLQFDDSPSYTYPAHMQNTCTCESESLNYYDRIKSSNISNT